MNKSNPPAEFTSRSQSETKTDEFTLEENTPPRLVPIPVSGDGGKTLDWSQSWRDNGRSPNPSHSNLVIQRELSQMLCKSQN